MQHGEASKTAEFNALFRAMESYRLPTRKRLFSDRLAPVFLGARARKFFRISRLPLLGHLVPLYIDTKWPGVRPSALGRTCWLDDQIRLGLQAGLQQVVILGAGYDCRAYRLPGMESRRVFELDQPGMIALKKQLLIRKLGALPGHVTYVEVDFDRQDLVDVLLHAGFDRSRATFFLWEGVMHYLSAEAVDHTLRAMASLASIGSRLAFTYIHEGLLDGTVNFGGLGEVPATLQESGETWKFGLYPEKLPEYLSDRGFTLVTDVGSTEYRTQYIGSSKHILKGFTFYRAALAEIRGKNTR